ncbi:MAG: DUF5615 family PIN-like protein [Bacteroidota bacterium]
MITLRLADENMPGASQRFLEGKGYDIKYISGPLAGIADDEVMQIAITEDRIIVTFDSDFGELVFKIGYQPKGVVFFRWPDFRPAEPGEYLHELIQKADIQLAGFFTVIDRNAIRQRPIHKH